MTQQSCPGPTGPISAEPFAELTPGHQHLLTLLRLFMDEFARPGCHAAIAALVYAEARLADRGGARLAYGALEAVQAIRRCRAADFTFRSACCQCCSQTLSRDESLLCGAFSAAMAGDHDALRRRLDLLAYGPDHAGLDQLLLRLARDLADPACRPCSTRH